MGILQNKKIVITGGSAGIGLAVAKHCAKEGAILILVSIHKEDLESAIKLLKHKNKSHRYYYLDVSVEKKVKEMAEDIGRDFGYIDGLVNCAGIYGPIGKTDETNLGDFVHTLEVNLLGTFYTCYHLIPLLKRASRGKIVNYAGGGVASPLPNYSAYAVSKTGIVKLTENMALEFRKENLDINAITPGFVVTKLHQETLKAGKKAGEGYLKKTIDNIKKGGVSPDIATRLTVFLLSKYSDGITGKFISADWDSWEDSNFLAKLRADEDFAVLRRIDDKFFFKKKPKV